MDFDTISLYPSAMWDEKTIYLTAETDCASTPDMQDENVEQFTTETFTQGCSILKVRY